MALIDIDKFVASIMYRWNNPEMKTIFNDMKYSLIDQGLEYKDNKIVKTQRTVSAEAKEAGYGESEDEQIRKEIIMIFKGQIPFTSEEEAKTYIAWLEKQKVTDEEIIFRPVIGTDIRIAAKQALEKIDIGKKVVLAFNGAYIPVNGKTVEEIDNEYDAWLEKQGEKESKKVSIWKHWKDGIAGGNEGEQIFLIKNGLHYSISSCLGYECDYIELSELDKLLSQEKQGSEPNWCHHKVDLSNCSEEYRKAYYDGWNNCNMQHEQCNAEHKLEPKFKVGDWIVRNYKDSGTFIYKVVDVKKINDESYGYKLDDGTYFSGSWEDVYHLWSIEDAKPGDVLVGEYDNCRKPWIGIFKCISNHRPETQFDSYCFINSSHHRFVTPENGGFYNPCQGHTNRYAKPVTKEQRDILFQKMKEAGYEWDADKKELKKIDWNDRIKYNPNAPSIIKESAWSEEDERAFHHVISVLEEYGEEHPTKSKFVCNWLKSIKARMKGDKV